MSKRKTIPSGSAAFGRAVSKSREYLEQSMQYNPLAESVSNEMKNDEKTDAVQDDNYEKIVDIDISKLQSFAEHTFKVVDDDDFRELKESIKLNGLSSPIIVRKKENGNYEIISGHRRTEVYRQLLDEGDDTKNCIKAIIREYDDDEATIVMAETNLVGRKNMRLSEKILSYNALNNALKHQGKEGLSAYEQVSTGESKRSYFRLIKLSSLLPKFLDMIDRKELGIVCADPIARLSKEEQGVILDAVESNEIVITTELSKKIKEYSDNGNTITKEALKALAISEPKIKEKLTFSLKELHNYFPDDMSFDDIKKEFTIYLESIKNKYQK